jgi:polar amino acid transport system substrate-binding protein
MRTVSRASKMFAFAAGLIAALLVAAPGEAGETLQKIKANGKMTVGTEAAFPPFEFIRDGKIVGYGKDILDKIVADMGVKLEQLDLPWQGILPGLLAGKFDFVATTVSVTPERVTKYAYTVPIGDGTPWAAKRKGDASIKTVDDLAGKVVGTQLASAGERSAKVFDEELKKKGLKPFKEIKLFTTYPEAYVALASGQVDTVLQALPNLAVLIKERPGIYELVGQVGEKNYMGWVTRPEDTDLRDFLSGKIKAMRDSGYLAELQDKWFGFRMELPDTGYLPPGAL